MLYTIVAEYGTKQSVSQSFSRDEESCVLQWVASDSAKKIGLDHSSAALILQDGTNLSDLTPIAGVPGVWCFSYYTDRLLMLSVVKTRSTILEEHQKCICIALYDGGTYVSAFSNRLQLSEIEVWLKKAVNVTESLKDFRIVENFGNVYCHVGKYGIIYQVLI